MREALRNRLKDEYEEMRNDIPSTTEGSSISYSAVEPESNLTIYQEFNESLVFVINTISEANLNYLIIGSSIGLYLQPIANGILGLVFTVPTLIMLYNGQWFNRVNINDWPSLLLLIAISSCSNAGAIYYFSEALKYRN